MADIVFVPSLAEGKTGFPTSRAERFLANCDVGRTVWTTKQNAESGDLYLFWFSQPVLAIVGIGLHTGKFRRDKHWGREGVFSPLRRLKSPVAREDIRKDPAMANWWAGSPFRGKPKTMLKHPDAVRRMLTLIIQRNPAIAEIVSPHLATIDEDAPAAKLNPLEAKRWQRILERLSAPDRERLRRDVQRAERERALRPLVLARWGTSCAVCKNEMTTHGGKHEVEVAHIEAVGGGGGDSPDNALPLCRTHHWAFDEHLWAIHPKRLTIVVAASFKSHPLLAPHEGKRLHARQTGVAEALEQKFLRARLKHLAE